MKNKIGNITRIALTVCGLALIAVLFVPLWTIDLIAPQYPEGLVLIIFPNGLGGNVDIINGLNHYIGMKTLHKENFIEFTILPYIIGTLAALFLIVAAIGRKILLYILTALYLLFGIISMVDFYKWNYDYGHDLDPNAAIKVPGMAYQPPLIGYKQLLNFSAYSMPATGGWIFFGAGLITLGFAISEWRKENKDKPVSKITTTAISIFLMFTLNSCSTEAEPIKFGTDQCHSCKMTISDIHYGAEIVTKKGKLYKFDDTHCVIEFIKSKTIEQSQIVNLYLVDFAGNGNLIDANSALLFKSDELRSPMGGNVSAFTNQEDVSTISKQYKGSSLTWKNLIK